jgi:hypothetical protein
VNGAHHPGYRGVEQHTRRPSDPQRLLGDPSLVQRLDEALQGAPWDVFTTPEVARALREELNPLTLNDWQYQRTPLRPPREPLAAWKGNVGYYRKDRLLAWANGGGEAIQSAELWPMSAKYTADVLSLQQPETRAETEELVSWLLKHGLVRLRAKPATPFQLFVEER